MFLWITSNCVCPASKCTWVQCCYACPQTHLSSIALCVVQPLVTVMCRTRNAGFRYSQIHHRTIAHSHCSIMMSICPDNTQESNIKPADLVLVWHCMKLHEIADIAYPFLPTTNCKIKAPTLYEVRVPPCDFLQVQKRISEMEATCNHYKHHLDIFRPTSFLGFLEVHAPNTNNSKHVNMCSVNK